MPTGLGFHKMFGYAGKHRKKVEVIPDESELPHTFKCECEVEWHENGVEPRPCWACGTLVTPKCYHM